VIPRSAFRKNLIAWYARSARDLPWRRTSDPYAIWVSEIMLQQTRVEAVLPYHQRFLLKFPTLESLAHASEQELLSAWAGLGYYSRVRNLQKAARRIAAAGEFPREYDGIRALPGIGAYTAAAIASIAFGLPHAALDGNVARVLARVSADPGDVKAPVTRNRLQALADDLLDRRKPGDFNQALMELGATVCLPRAPQCLLCPLARLCEARRAGRQNELPVRGGGAIRTRLDDVVMVCENNGRILLRRRDSRERRLAGFWELPGRIDGLPGELVGRFRHAIVNHDYVFEVRTATLDRAPRGHHWWPIASLGRIPLTTTARKAIACWNAAKVEK
jgi:A/G-specific adenine glycosylase